MSALEKFKLGGKIALVTGGGGQIGSCFVKSLTDVGAIVHVIDKDDELLKKIGTNCFSYAADITAEKDIENIITKIINKSGKIDILVNAAHFKGNSKKLDTTSNFFAPFENYPLEAWNNVINVNLTGMFLCTQKVAKQMIKQKNGIIVNVSSTYGIVSPDQRIYGKSGINSPVSYATTKAGIINFTRYIATYLAPYGIRANTLSPGGVYNNQDLDFVNNYIQRTPLNRMATVDDYAGALLFLCSDASSYMTGSNLVVDGGWTAW